MKISLSQSDQEKVMGIEEIRKRNFEVIGMYSYYLINHKDYITKQWMDSIVHEGGLSEEYAYFGLLTTACGLDIENNRRDLDIARAYFIPSIRKLEAETYRENPYYKNIRIPVLKLGNWEFKSEKYKPYEAFIYNDILVDRDFREIPRLGFFNGEFSFPAVLESGNEWMTLTPNEIETMQPVIEAAKGNVITFGLGLGYFTYMVSQKEQVQSVTVVEKDEKVIWLFQKYILPQFAYKEKVKIVLMDAFQYMKKHMANGKYDCAFVDLWHDVSDGLGLYLGIRKLEPCSPDTQFFYWIEDSILSHLRWYVFMGLLEEMKAENESNLPQALKGKCIRSFDEFTYYLGSPFIKKLAADIQSISASL